MYFLFSLPPRAISSFACLAPEEEFLAEEWMGRWEGEDSPNLGFKFGFNPNKFGFQKVPAAQESGNN